MRNKSFICMLLTACCILLGSCKVGNVPSSQGLSDQAFLYFASDHKYSEPVTVVVDHKTNFNAKVVRERKGTVKGSTYAIATGKRHIKVSYEGKVLFERDVFIATQETKKITLP